MTNAPAVSPLTTEKVAIVGFSETTRYLAPFDDPSWEIWTCNRLNLQKGLAGKRWTRHFDPHPPEWSAAHFTANDWPEYEAWLMQDHGNVIYMQDHYPQFPNSAPLPIMELIEMIGGRRYFASVIAMQLGLAILLGAKEIALYGVDLRHDTEYVYQRPNVEYLIGFAEARGIKVTLPPGCALLQNEIPDAIYGYEFEAGKSELEQATEARVKELSEAFKTFEKQREQLNAQLFTYDGALQEARHWHARARERRRGGIL